MREKPGDFQLVIICYSQCQVMNRDSLTALDETSVIPLMCVTLDVRLVAEWCPLFVQVHICHELANIRTDSLHGAESFLRS